MKTKFKLIPYNNKLIPRALALRNNMTKAECMVWNLLKKKQMLGFDFDRQRTLLNYIVDFFCYELYLVIEIDGYSHEHSFQYDRKREIDLKKYEIEIIRFSNKDVIFGISNIERSIKTWIENNKERQNLFLNKNNAPF